MASDTDLKHLLDLPAGQVYVQLVEKLVNLFDVQQTISILISLLKRLLHPRITQTHIKENECYYQDVIDKPKKTLIYHLLLRENNCFPSLKCAMLMTRRRVT